MWGKCWNFGYAPCTYSFGKVTTEKSENTFFCRSRSSARQKETVRPNQSKLFNIILMTRLITHQNYVGIFILRGSRFLALCAQRQPRCARFRNYRRSLFATYLQFKHSETVSNFCLKSETCSKIVSISVKRRFRCVAHCAAQAASQRRARRADYCPQ